MRALYKVVRRAALVALAGLVLTTPAVAQTGLATVTGLVADSSGAAVPGVTVTATNQATNIAYTGVTNDAGNYVITSVPIGEYVIAAALTGFKGVQSKVTLSVAQTARVDFKMGVVGIAIGRSQLCTPIPRTESTATGDHNHLELEGNNHGLLEALVLGRHVLLTGEKEGNVVAARRVGLIFKEALNVLPTRVIYAFQK